METREHIQQLRVVGGDPALDFVNTESGPAGGPPDHEALREYDDFVLWSVQIGLLSEGAARRMLARAATTPDDARAAYTRCIATRGYLHGLFSALAAGRPPAAEQLVALRSDEVDALGHSELVADGSGFVWTWEHDEDLVAPLRSIVHAATELLRRGPLDRVKGCGGCSFLFLDESKNGSRRWCSMEDCGAAEKARRYVARRAAARRAGS